VSASRRRRWEEGPDAEAGRGLEREPSRRSVLPAVAGAALLPSPGGRGLRGPRLWPCPGKRADRLSFVGLSAGAGGREESKRRGEVLPCLASPRLAPRRARF